MLNSVDELVRVCTIREAQLAVESLLDQAGKIAIAIFHNFELFRFIRHIDAQAQAVNDDEFSSVPECRLTRERLGQAGIRHCVGPDKLDHVQNVAN